MSANYVQIYYLLLNSHTLSEPKLICDRIRDKLSIKIKLNLYFMQTIHWFDCYFFLSFCRWSLSGDRVIPNENDMSFSEFTNRSSNWFRRERSFAKWNTFKAKLLFFLRNKWCFYANLGDQCWVEPMPASEDPSGPAIRPVPHSQALA